MDDMNIVILTKYFGYNYTGATVATHTLIQKWNRCETVVGITVLTLNVGEYNPTSKLHVIKMNDNRQLREKAFKLKDHHTIFYSDDHLGYMLSGLPYIHTYHGNWPDARFISLEMFLKSFYFINRYGETIRHAAMVVNVSHYMKKFTDRFNRKSVVIRNGVAEIQKIDLKNSSENKVLMIGTLEQRKYGKLVDLLKVLPSYVHIDAYGNIANKKLAEKLEQYPNFTAKGFVNFHDIPLYQYSCLLSLSVMENMPISLVEILKSGMPVIAYAVGGIPEIVNDNCGFLFSKEANALRIAEALQNVIDGKKDFNTNQPELNAFDWSIAAKRYLEVFDNVLMKAGDRQ